MGPLMNFIKNSIHGTTLISVPLRVPSLNIKRAYNSISQNIDSLGFMLLIKSDQYGGYKFRKTKVV